MIKRLFLYIIYLISFWLIYFISTNNDIFIGIAKYDRVLEYSNKTFEPFKTKNNIFFLETNFARNLFDFKQQCSIESAAKNNQNSTIYVLSVKARFQNEVLQKSYKNIKVIKMQIDKLLNNTILHEWWFNGKYNLSNFKTAHLSDALRLFILFKFGGIYSDLDAITIRNLESLSKYPGLGTLDDSGNLGNGFLNFEKGNIFLLVALKEFVKNYNPYYWSYNGPRVLAKVLLRYCKIGSHKELIINETLLNDENRKQENATKTCNISLYPQNIIYPVSWIDKDLLFQHNSSLNLTKFLNTYSIHFYGKLTYKYKIVKNENSIYEYFAKKHCPVSYTTYLSKS